jgi:hypothetical protein
VIGCTGLAASLVGDLAVAAAVVAAAVYLGARAWRTLAGGRGGGSCCGSGPRCPAAGDLEARLREAARRVRRPG